MDSQVPLHKSHFHCTSNPLTHLITDSLQCRWRDHCYPCHYYHHHQHHRWSNSKCWWSWWWSSRWRNYWCSSGCGADSCNCHRGCLVVEVRSMSDNCMHLSCISYYCILLCRRYSPQDKYSTKTSPPARPPPPVHFKKAPQNGEGEKTVGE